MHKILIKNNQDLKDAITFFGIEWENLIKEEVKEFFIDNLIKKLDSNGLVISQTH